MTKSILNGKRILAVDDEADVLAVLEEEILEACPDCKFDKAATYHGAAEMLKSQEYDIVILDIMGVRGFDLLKMAMKCPYPVAMLTAHALFPESLKRSIKLGARAYLPKEKLGQIVPFLEDVLKYDYLPGWKRLLKKLERYFNTIWGDSWQKSEAKFWNKFKENATLSNAK